MSDSQTLVQGDSETALTEEPDLPPVVARMVVEIRSDGTRTVARGALEDRLRGETVQLKLESGSPLMLARQLAETLMRTRSLAERAAALVLAGRRRKR
jgi:hypothetical protein